MIMDERTPRGFTLATAGFALLFGTQVTAQDRVDTAKFAAPKRIKAGDDYLGTGRLYPSPALYDVDGDKLPDIVIGDLWGKITFARREASKPAVLLGAEVAMKDRSGERLDFQNW